MVVPSTEAGQRHQLLAVVRRLIRQSHICVFDGSYVPKTRYALDGFRSLRRIEAKLYVQKRRGIVDWNLLRPNQANPLLESRQHGCFFPGQIRARIECSVVRGSNKCAGKFHWGVQTPGEVGVHFLLYACTPPRLHGPRKVPICHGFHPLSRDVNPASRIWFRDVMRDIIAEVLTGVVPPQAGSNINQAFLFV